MLDTDHADHEEGTEVSEAIGKASTEVHAALCKALWQATCQDRKKQGNFVDGMMEAPCFFSPQTYWKQLVAVAHECGLEAVITN